MIFVEVVVEERPVGFALDSLSPFPQHDRFLILLLHNGDHADFQYWVIVTICFSRW